MNDQYRHSVFFDYGVTEQPNANQEKVADKERDQKEAHNRSFTSNTPALHLHVIEPIRRNNTQARLLQEARLGQAQQPGSLVLDPSLDYAYWKCHLGPLLPNAVLNDKPFGYQPEQPMEWVSTNGAHVDAAARPVPNEVNLILFNVLVALEWTPDEAYMYQLEWAFRRASDYLYDVTDGRMAFGQVIFGGKDCMDCCDFQIMASNRFHPRSWVSGMHDPRKYLPVRLGRGNWHPGNRVSIPWDEPEAYRPLVHEWGHYALGLKDEYLEPRWVRPTNEVGIMQVPAQLLIESMPADADYTVAIPKTSLESQSIMAITIGTSEIVAHAHGNRRRRKSREWETITRLFGIEQPERLLEGPGRLPLPLPQFVQLFQPSNTELPQFPSRYKAEDVFDLLPPDVQFDHCWIYVVRNLNDEQPELTPQGTLTARSRDDGLELLGAQEGDTMVLTAAHPTMPCVLQGSIGQEGKLVEWDNRTPTSLPLIQVVPQQMNPAHQRASVRVQVIADKHPDQVWVFPLGGAESAIQMQHQQGSTVWESAPNRNTTLDGHVLARWGQEHLLIVPFSQGGGPPSNGAFAPVPITAGSADGGVMIFFYDKNRHAREKEDEFSRVKVVTTTNNAAYGTRPNLSWRPYSYPFTIASNGPLPLECVPTLVVRHEQPGERELLTGDLLIGRLQGDQWTVQPTYLPAGAPFVAMPLTDTTAPGLFHQRGGIEHYQVFWVPRLIS